MDIQIEILQIFSLILCVFLLQTPLNYFLMGRLSKELLKCSAKSIVIVIFSWIMYRLSFESAMAAQSFGLLLTLIVLANLFFYWSLIKFQVQKYEEFLEGRMWGWILFSPLLSIAEITSTPLITAIIKSAF